MDKLRSTAIEFGQLAVDTLSQPQILWQLIAIGALFIPAWFLSSWIEPKLEERARGIKGMPGLLRIIIAFLRRFEWVFYVLLLAATYMIATALLGPESSYLVYSVMLLSESYTIASITSPGLLTVSSGPPLFSSRQRRNQASTSRGVASLKRRRSGIRSTGRLPNRSRIFARLVLDPTFSECKFST